MGDEDDRRAGAGAQVAHQVEDLRLDRDVERGRGLVRDEQLRLAGERHRDHHALAHAARHLMRIGVDPRLRRGDAHEPEHVERPPPRLLAGEATVAAQALDDLVAHPVDRIERRHRLLEDHGERGSAQILHLGTALLQEVLAGEQHFAAGAPAGRLLHEPHHGERGHALAAAGLTDDAERPAGATAKLTPSTAR